ncbi:MAG: hypothetical protein V4591_10730 [Bdellovibrionota bacterium]
MKKYFEKNIQIAKKYELKCKKIDNQIAAFRLISTIGLLALLVSLAQGKSFFTIFLFASLFLIYCLLTSFYHKKKQQKQKFWSSMVKSYSLSQARVSRNFTFLAEHVSPWHANIAILPKNHMYACDIDVHTNLFLFMNTCSTEGGSQKLFQLLTTAGMQPCNKDIINKNIDIAKKLSCHKSLLRRFEALRLSEDFLKNYYASKSSSEESTNSTAQSSSVVVLGYGALSILIWIFLFIPLFFKFMHTKNIDLFLQPLFIYAAFILFGTYIFQPLVDRAMLVSRNIKYIQTIVKSLNSKISLEYLFLKPSEVRKISFINGFIDIFSLRGNPIFWIFIHIFFPFDAVFSIALFFVLKKINSDVSIWQNEVHEFDLLASFARLKVENPEFNFFVAHSENEVVNYLKVTDLGHPLLAYSTRISNSLLLEKNSPLVLLTGSNMSGKSTFLRCLATNILLANMGAPVCAKEFILPQMRILCAIRIDDSLSDGTSYFYAEVKRLAEILQQLKTSSVPCLFFVDEIFKGTNNKERFLGSIGILKAFLELGVFGFVSTHDLALTELAEQESRLRNMHFRERIEGERLTFDYTLKEGPCPTTNALFIMKMAGLPVFNVAVP